MLATGGTIAASLTISADNMPTAGYGEACCSLRVASSSSTVQMLLNLPCSPRSSNTQTINPHLSTNRSTPPQQIHPRQRRISILPLETYSDQSFYTCGMCVWYPTGYRCGHHGRPRSDVERCEAVARTKGSHNFCRPYEVGTVLPNTPRSWIASDGECERGCPGTIEAATANAQGRPLTVAELQPTREVVREFGQAMIQAHRQRVFGPQLSQAPRAPAVYPSQPPSQQPPQSNLASSQAYRLTAQPLSLIHI